jgi:poly-gamma-glutamate system protein
VLLALAAGALLMQWGLQASRKPVRQGDYELKLAAAEKAAEAFEAVRQYRRMEGAVLEMENDPAGTGLVGPETSPITNTTGNLDSKLTCLNPNMAAVVLSDLRMAGLRKGDPVAVAVSGSFPGMNIAVFAALEVMELDPVVTTSVGASGWGATDPDFTWLDMERLFHERGVFSFRSVAASHGGGDDMGRGLSEYGRQKILDSMHRNEVPPLQSSHLEQAIAKRMALYEEKARGRLYRSYINVGGGLASIGHAENRYLIPLGLSFDLGPKNWPLKGCLTLFSEKGVPVIHYLSLQTLARRTGLPVAPLDMPEVGEGEVFLRESYRLGLAFLFFVLYSVVIVVVLAPELRRGIFDRWRGKVDGDSI